MTMISTLIALPYELARLPLVQIDQRLASRLSEDSRTRVTLDRAIGTADQLAGALLRNDQIALRGTDRMDRSGKLAEAARLEAEAEARRQAAEEAAEAGRREAAAKRKAAAKTASTGLTEAQKAEAEGKKKAAADAKKAAARKKAAADKKAAERTETVEQRKKRTAAAAEAKKKAARDKASAELAEAKESKEAAVEAHADAERAQRPDREQEGRAQERLNRPALLRALTSTDTGQGSRTWPRRLCSSEAAGALPGQTPGPRTLEPWFPLQLPSPTSTTSSGGSRPRRGWWPRPTSQPRSALVIMLRARPRRPSVGQSRGQGAPGHGRSPTRCWRSFCRCGGWRAAGLQPYPWAADLLVTVPCFSDILGNRLDLYDQIVWFDDWVHFMNTGLLSAAFLLLTRRSSETPGAILARSVAFGLSVSLLWEIGEYAAFITTSSEMPTAYADTLMDLSLGWLGAVTAAVAVIVARKRSDALT